MAMDLTQCLRALEISVLERKEEDVVSSVAAINEKVIDSGELEEWKEIVMCLCRGNYLTALQGKTSQHLLKVTAVTAGEISTIPIDNPIIDVPLVLFLAKIILLENEKALDMCQTACLWALRYLGVQRQLFYESNEITEYLEYSFQWKEFTRH
ncbi:uncharacterized protein [Montipora capricornis]|uniref:uncharacterized protein n=1 Tax=Montipora capricornis TaxID=246305 RepID=UPI0035F1D5C3